MDAQQEMRRQTNIWDELKVRVWTVGGVEGKALSVCVFTQTCSSIGRPHNFSSLILMAIHWAHKKNTGPVYFSVCVGWMCCFALATQELLDSPIFILKMSLFWRMCHAAAPQISLLSSLWNLGSTEWWETLSPIFLRASLDSQLAHAHGHNSIKYTKNHATMQISLLASLDGLCLSVPGYVFHATYVTGTSSTAQDTWGLKVAVAYKILNQ